MKNQVIFAKDAPQAVGPYSHAVRAGNTVYVSGQLGLVPETGDLVAGVAAQAHQALANLQAVLASAGMGMEHVVRTTVFLVDMADFAAVNAVYAEAFGDCKPARACIAVAALPKGGLVEVDCVACD